MMSRRSSLAALAAIVLAASAQCISAQALSGTYTCANGNPGSAFDYADIGDFFNDLESFGVGGAVTLDVYDDGGPFTSSPTYQLGADGTSQRFLRPVAGLSASQTLTIRAALGEAPIIEGSGAPARLYGPGAIRFDGVSHTTVDGLEIRNGQNSGINWFVDSGNVQQIRISRCRIHSIANGSAVLLRTFWTEPRFHNVTIENNMFWGCPGGSGDWGVLEINRSGMEIVVRHNTVLTAGCHDAFRYVGPSSPWTVFENNVVYLQGQSEYVIWQGGPDVVNVDGNVFYLGATGKVSPQQPTWAQWQASGKDPNGLNTDPLLENITPGFEDLHLKPNSPAIDLIQFSGVNIDADGDPRPIGIVYDSGADEVPKPEIEVEYGAVNITDGGSVNVGAGVAGGSVFTFTVRNVGTTILQLTGTPPVVLVPGANCGPGTAVQTQPPIAVTTTAAATFSVFVEPLATGPFSLQVSIDNNDNNESPFDFTITGSAYINVPAQANPAPGSSLAGPVNGPFTLVLNPGTIVPNALIELRDGEGDAITVTAITPPPAVLGIVGPTTPAPGHPLTLAWTGTADAANPPGPYTWTIDFEDAASGIPSSCTVTITINDLPPTHSPLASGNGSPGNPYTASFTEGDGPAAGIDLCSVADPNTQQTVTLTSVTPSPGNPGAIGFDITQAGALLHAAPSGVLTAAEAGSHHYTAQISDGGNTATIHIRLDVSVVVPLTITTTTLPSGDVDTPYSEVIQANGGVGAITFTVTAGSLPAGLSLNPLGLATALLDGTPTKAGTTTFTVQAQDTQGRIATQTLQLKIKDQPKTNPNNSGCSGTQTDSSALVALLLAATGLMLCRRRVAADRD